MRSDYTDKHKVNVFDYSAEMCADEELVRYNVVTVDSWHVYLVISEVLRVLELQIGRDQISEVKSGNGMLEGLRLVRVKDGLIGLG